MESKVRNAGNFLHCQNGQVLKIYQQNHFSFHFLSYMNVLLSDSSFSFPLYSFFKFVVPLPHPGPTTRANKQWQGITMRIL